MTRRNAQSDIVRAVLLAAVAGATAALAATRHDARRRTAPARDGAPGPTSPATSRATTPTRTAPAAATAGALTAPSTSTIPAPSAAFSAEDYHLATRDQLVSLALRIGAAIAVLLAVVGPFVVGETRAVARRMWALMPWLDPGTALALLGGIAVLIVALGLDQAGSPSESDDDDAPGAGDAPGGRAAAAVRRDIQRAVLSVSSVSAIGVGLTVVLWGVVAWTGNLPDATAPARGTLLATVAGIGCLAVLLARVGIGTGASRWSGTRGERERIEAALDALPARLAAAAGGIDVPRRWLVWPWPTMWAPTIMAAVTPVVVVAVGWVVADLPLRFLAFVPLITLQAALAAALSIEVGARWRARVHPTFTGSVALVVLALSVVAVGIGGATEIATAGAPAFRWTMLVATLVPAAVTAALAAGSVSVRRRLAVHGELVRSVPGVSVTYRHAFVSRLHHT